MVWIKDNETYLNLDLMRSLFVVGSDESYSIIADYGNDDVCRIFDRFKNKEEAQKVLDDLMKKIK